MAFAIKAAIDDPLAVNLVLSSQKTMYGGKRVAKNDIIFVFASENEGGQGLIARGVVVSASAVPRIPGVARQTRRISLRIRFVAAAKRRLGRGELRRYSDWKDGRPETELNFRLYRQATNKVIGIADRTAAFLDGFF
jgi:hypothetical protein